MYFSHGSTLPVAVSAAALLARFCARGTLLRSLPAIAGGLCLFCLLEYLIHRFVLHARPSRNGLILRVQMRMHVGHHIDPTNLPIVFIPVGAVAALAFAFANLYGWLGLNVAAWMSGNLIGLLHYEWTHFTAHFPAGPGTRWGRFLRRNHLLHHYHNEHYWVGVTSPLFDVLLGTWARPEAVDRSPTVRDNYAVKRG